MCNLFCCKLNQQNAKLYHRLRKQQHPRPAHSSEGSKNVPKWWSPRLGHGAVLAASKPLQVSKYPSKELIIHSVSRTYLSASHTNEEELQFYYKQMFIILTK